MTAVLSRPGRDDRHRLTRLAFALLVASGLVDAVPADPRRGPGMGDGAGGLLPSAPRARP